MLPASAACVVNGYWYDRIKRDMRKQELREIPFVGDIDRLNDPPQRTRPLARNGAVKTVAKAGITCIERPWQPDAPLQQV